eukprot:CAMPEP_0202711342 /NCGR_PEP_ID=MMETSP1385-20130828/23175_1 /ASSEMBLY_ACC=CAM_ASM_000861 /TAXON_ID=933848 /ORGANISM="Elphidium margaritaceum" /LENGTH=142 /DNA_ID=CAMNT_0049371067 /DNA_START=100 /DNA_END=525 /DNA_ORIENTATION=+
MMSLEKRQRFLTKKIEQSKSNSSEQTQLEQYLDEVNDQLLALQQRQFENEMQQMDDATQLQAIQDLFAATEEQKREIFGDRLATLQEVNERLIMYKKRVHREKLKPGFKVDDNKRYALYSAQLKRLLQYRMQMKNDRNVKIW